MSLVSLRLVDSVRNNKADSKIEKENVDEKERASGKYRSTIYISVYGEHKHQL